MNDFMIGALFAGVLSALVTAFGFVTLPRHDPTETALQSAFNEGVEHGTCLAIKGRVSAEAMDECWENKDE